MEYRYGNEYYKRILKILINTDYYNGTFVVHSYTGVVAYNVNKLIAEELRSRWVNPKFYHMTPILINPLKIGKIENVFRKVKYHSRIIVPQLRYPWKSKKQKKSK